MSREKQIDYKEYARQMRENCVKGYNGTEPIVFCSLELWEEIATIIEGYRNQSEGEGFILPFDGTTEYFNKEVVLYAVKAYMRRNGWIPVAEALPEEGSASVVAVIYRDNPLQDWECVVTAAYFVPINGKIDGMWVLLNDEKIESKEIHITHWMPLPEAPKGGAE